MAGRIGRKVDFRWGGSLVPGVREKSAACNGAPINVSSDESDGWQYLLAEAGENSVTISISGVTKSDALKQAWFSGNRTEAVTMGYPDGGELEGQFFMASYTEGEPYNEASTFQAELQSTDGAVSYTPGAAPVNNVLPAISGEAVEDGTLTALVGKWSGSPSAFSYQWQQDDGGWTNISGATSASYTPVTANVGNALRVIVTATNGAGSTSATSAPTPVVAGA
ncbi:MAG: phage tail tube protein [Thermaurantiacus sp.]